LLTVGGIGAVAIAAVISGIVKARTTDPLSLMVCMQSMRAPLAWACTRSFYGLHPTPDEVRELNASAAATHFVAYHDLSEARRMLAHYVQHGGDVNAIHERGATALHSAVMSNRGIEEACLLLAFGADPRIKDAKGRTPLDVAQHLRKRGESATLDRLIAILSTVESGGPSRCLDMP
jgi:hypothetical protein